MFTGIIEELGAVKALDQQGDSATLTIQADVVLEGVTHGASIAVNGTCLTVTQFDADSFTVDVMAESLDRTSLGALTIGSPVNLERAVRADGRLDGHIVQGHVDGTAVVTAVRPAEHWTEVEIDLSAHLAPYVAEKGSIALDGVSLTVARVGSTDCTVCLIPTTLELTTMGSRRVGDRLNVEVDVLAKYVERLHTMSATGPSGK